MKIYKQNKVVMVLLLVFGLMNCTQSDFLDVKPNSGILVPNTLEDVEKLLNNNIMQTISSGLSTISADEYIIDEANWNALTTIERNASVWNQDIYEGEKGIRDWSKPYEIIYYSNCALSVLDKLKVDKRDESKFSQLKGWSLFMRAYANYELLRVFCKSYDVTTAHKDLGIPLRTTPDIDVIMSRSSLEESYEFVLNDLLEASALLRTERNNNFSQPNRLAVFAFLARVFLDMGAYKEAEYYAESLLSGYNKLIDYNLIDKNASTPFSTTHDEMLYRNMTNGGYDLTSLGSLPRLYWIDPDLIKLYEEGDLRISIYFIHNGSGRYVMKRGYGGSGAYGFSGLATDEVWLIKAECLARRGENLEALKVLSDLLKNRYVKGKAPSVSILQARGDVLMTIQEERRKELVWRSLRWSDIKRYNREGQSIRLIRKVGERTFELSPNDNKFVLPIPDDEIAFSGITQNKR